jgi:hypothetical protein
MSGKTVHWADQNKTYSYSSSSTPSPASTSSTLSTSPGPLTPPPLSPSAFPSKEVGLVVLHIVLTSEMASQYHFDISKDPAQTNSTVLTPQVLAEAATSPPLSEILLVSRYLPWRLEILPSSSKPDAFVTVSDVLGGLYCALRIAVKEGEFNSLAETGQRKVKEAFKKRCADKDAEEKEREKGMKRIDYMMGHHRFAGLSLTQLPHEFKVSARQ